MVTTDGSPPTKENLMPIRESSMKNGGRGSIVWFTQASMLISAELPVPSISKARDANKAAIQEGKPLIDLTFNAEEALKQGFFPYDIPPSPPT